MIIELHHNDGTAELPEICCTELTAPTVIQAKGKFFIKAPCDPRITLTAAKYLLYRECRGEFLSNIVVSRSDKSEEVLA